MRTVEIRRQVFNVTTQLAVIACPVNSTIRIIGVRSQMVCTEGDQISVTFRKGSEQMLRTSTNMMPACVTEVCAFIGAGNSVSRAELIDPVTGVVTFNQFQAWAELPLPDNEWDGEITLLISIALGTLGVGSVLYEVIRQS